MNERRKPSWASLRAWIRAVPLKAYDIAVFVVAVGIIVSFSVFALERSGPARAAEIKSDDGTFIYTLEENREIDVVGPLGVSRLVIEDGTVRFTESPCRDKICVATGHLSESGQWSACLPNRVFVTIVGEHDHDEEDGIDATAF